ncbi:hypothetical protein LTR84_012227 [Exophiala bonariae]|uniref:Uncharacterized protein n=1 Tax=Exophiala bonariae TaxID=1690606 RepID=A0AAV9NJ93_9EURO|nr:hypothetical protein LTR84_012227 [Exophiala bonariae]
MEARPLSKEVGTAATSKENKPLTWCALAWETGTVVDVTKDMSSVLRSLACDGCIFFQFVLKNPTSDAPQPDRNSVGLSIIMYGPSTTGDRVGEYLLDCRLYLQTPRFCDHNVPYINPHCLFVDDESFVMSNDLDTDLQLAPDSRIQSFTDIFAGMASIEALKEAQQPKSILTPLHAHQKQALTFMKRREDGWQFHDKNLDLWTAHSDIRGATKFENVLTGHRQFEPPPPFHGGVIADPMGLGKTLTMLSLIASNTWTDPSRSTHLNVHGFPTVKTTLVVVPFSLLFVWSMQLNLHVKPGQMSTCVFHGARRHLIAANLFDYDVVITTLNTVASEWKRHRDSRTQSGRNKFFTTYWHRIVLDEAHMVRSQRTNIARAICALESHHRWCITGTPIQNKLGDLYSLLKFLRIHPYDSLEDFERDIAQPWRNQLDEAALHRIQLLVRMIALRRSRDVVRLPQLTEHICYVNFGPRERKSYELARKGAVDVIDSAMSAANSSGSSFITALQKINNLRFICNHGTLFARRRHLRKQSRQVFRGMHETDALDMMNTSNGICIQCGTDIQEEDEESRLLDDRTSSFDLSHSELCKKCLELSENDASLSPATTSSDDTASEAPEPHDDEISSKAIALLEYLDGMPHGDRCVVFTFWTSTLDIIEQALARSCISSCRYDGKLSRARRDLVLRTFAQDISINVILVSISCGGQGLDLTAANHAVLVEPQWNPMMEEQAISRVYRLGQTKSVTAVRLVVKDTWEEKIMAVQARKKTLADLVMNQTQLKGEDKRSQLWDSIRICITTPRTTVKVISKMASSAAPAVDQIDIVGSLTHLHVEGPNNPTSNNNDAKDASKPVLKSNLDNVVEKLSEEQSAEQGLYGDELAKSDDEDDDHTPSEDADEYSEYESDEDDEIATIIKESSEELETAVLTKDSGEDSGSEYSENSDDEVYQLELEVAAYEYRKMYEAEQAILAAKQDEKSCTELNVDLKELAREADEEISRSEQPDEEILTCLPDSTTFGAYGQNLE